MLRNRITVLLAASAMLSIVGLSLPAKVEATISTTYYVAAGASRAQSHTPGGSCTKPGWIGSTEVAIQGAVDAATGAGSNRTVYICLGDYYIHNTIMVDAPLVLRGAGVKKTLLNGHDAKRLISTNQALTVANMKLANGYSDGDDGGAIFSTYDVTIASCDLTDNRADRGGAIFSEGLVTTTKSNFIGNSALYSDGGAIFSEGAALFTNSSFNENTAADDGGAIRSESEVTLDHSSLTSNGAEGNDGGAVYADGEVTALYSAFNGNHSDADGGAIRSESSMIIQNSTFGQNSATNYGGALYGDDDITILTSRFTSNYATGNNGGAVRGEAIVTVTGSAFTTNWATDGGAIDAGDSSVVVVNSRFTNNHTQNTTDGSGGAINAAYLAVTKSTFTGNWTVGVGGDGGAISFAFVSVDGISGNTFKGNSAGGDGGAIAQWCGHAYVESDYLHVNKFSGNVGDLHNNVLLYDNTCE